jgi:PPOX class probable FMN-dependent enzyme
VITTLEQLRALYAQPGERARRKQGAQLDAHAQRFVALSPFCVIATGGGAGALLDASPRGGAPGFVRAMNAHTLLLPDAGGNNRLDTFQNLLQDPRIGLLFLIPGVDETLRVNGTARLRDEPEFTDLFVDERQRPKVVIEVQVTEVYLHCAKAFMRSRLWQADAKIDRAVLPSMNQMISDQMDLGKASESQEDMVKRYESLLAEERAR